MRRHIMDSISYINTLRNIHQLRVNTHSMEDFNQKQEIILYYAWENDEPMKIVEYLKQELNCSIVNKTEFMRLLNLFKTGNPKSKNVKNENFIY